MRYWWVNQNQTYRHEVAGRYLWSPKRKANGHNNAFYDFMRVVAPGDVVLSFCDTYIKAIGIAASNAYESPKPLEFGQAGAYWDRIGWRVDVSFVELRGPMRPAAHMDVLGPFLPAKYSPLRPNGNGLQSVYLTILSEDLAGKLIDLIGSEAHDLLRGVARGDSLAEGAIGPLQPAIGLAQWEEHQMDQVKANIDIPETEREQIVLARRGQGEFKRRVSRIEMKCRITQVTRPEHLRASHCKPWRAATNAERLDGENGLLLTPNADHLFDRGFIGFEDNGDVLVSPVAHLDSLARLGVDPTKRQNVGRFTEGQRRYLEYHRDAVLLKSSYLESDRVRRG